MSTSANNLDHLSPEERAAFEQAMGRRGFIRGWQGVGVLALSVALCFALFGLLISSMSWFAPKEQQRMLRDQERTKKKLSIEERVYPEKRS